MEDEKIEEAPPPKVGLPLDDHTVARMSDEQLREFVLGIVDRSLFCSLMINPNDLNLLGCIFMPLSLGALKDWSEEETADIGCLYAPMSAAGPRGINGYPMFTMVKLCHKDDWVRALAAITKEEERRKNIEV